MLSARHPGFCKEKTLLPITTNMPQKPDFILRFSLQNIEDFSPDAIARSPRDFRPGDLINACNNVVIEPVGKKPPDHIASIARFVTVDFFALAHGTGLYNRQPKLWEGLAKTATIQIFVKKKGLLHKTELPEFDMLLLDHKGRTIAITHYTAPESSGVKHDYMGLFKEFVKRTRLRQARQRQGVLGVFVCYPAPFPEKLREYVMKEANAHDAVQRYESVLPALGVPIDLFEIDSTASTSPSGATQYPIRLVHPDLNKKKSWIPVAGRGITMELEGEPADIPDEAPN